MSSATGADAPGRRAAPVEMSPDAFRQAGHQLVDQIAAWLDGLGSGPVVPDETPARIRQVLGADQPLPVSGSDPALLLSETASLLFRHSLFNGHPRFFGYITSSAAPIGALADLLASAVNQNVGAWRLSPLATEIEAQTVRWIAELLGYPTDAGGVLVSGGTMANFVGLSCARAVSAPAEIRASGIGSIPGRLRLYASTETHTWLRKAADLFGLGTDAIRWIDTDAAQRIRIDVLEARIAADRAAGDRPFLVVGTAGSVSTGVVDPLRDLASVCRHHGLWFHVDGAYGAFAARVPGAPEDLRALAEADSIAVDPHKWLYAPLEAGCVLVRRAEHLQRTFAHQPDYYHFDHDVTNYFERGPQNSRGFRALKVWLALRQVGLDGYVRMIGDDIELARRLSALVAQREEFQALTQRLSITTFRYVPVDLRPSIGTPEVEAYLNRLNGELLSRIERSGEAFLSNAVIDGRFALRACVVNFRTSRADIDAVPGLAARLGRELDASLRHRSPG